MALLGKDHISTLIYLTVDVNVIGVVTFLQIQTVRKANALHNESTVAVSEIINKKITKLSMRIMLLLCFLITPHLIVFTVSEAIRYQLNIYEKGIFEFFHSCHHTGIGLCQFICQCCFVLNDKRESKESFGKFFTTITEKVSKYKKINKSKQVFSEIISHAIERSNNGFEYETYEKLKYNQTGITCKKLLHKSLLNLPCH